MSNEKEFEKFEKLTDEELKKMLEEFELGDEDIGAAAGGSGAQKEETEEECLARWERIKEEHRREHRRRPLVFDDGNIRSICEKKRHRDHHR